MFVSTRCPVSNAYNDRTIAFAKDFGARNVRFYGIDSNKEETPQEIAGFANQHSFNFPILKDDRNEQADRFAASVTPEAYVIDARGVLRYHGQVDDSKDAGAVTQHTLQDALAALLAGKTIAKTEVPAFGCSIKRVEQ